MTETASAPKTVPRKDIMEILGVTYAHSGDWRSPIVELVGRRVVDSDAVSDRQMFSRERDAEDHVLRLARYEAETKLPLMEQLFSSRRLRFKLWLAQNWAIVRRRSTGLLATHAIHQSKADLYRRIRDNRFRPEVKRLPDRLRVPAVIVLDSPIWVVDTDGFPNRPATIVEDRISALEYEDAGHSSDYDFRVRYRLAITRGTFLYDHADTTCDVLASPGLKVRAYLREEQARQFLRGFHQHVHSMLASSSEYTPLLTGPEDRLIALPSPEPVQHGIEEVPDAFAAVSDEQEVDGIDEGRRAILHLLLARQDLIESTTPETFEAEQLEAAAVAGNPEQTEEASDSPPPEDRIGEDQDVPLVLDADGTGAACLEATEEPQSPDEAPVQQTADTAGGSSDAEDGATVPSPLEAFLAAPGDGAIVVHRLSGSDGKARLAMDRLMMQADRRSEAA